MTTKTIPLSLLICSIMLFSSEKNMAGPSKERMALSLMAGTTTAVVCLPFVTKASAFAVCLCCTTLGTCYGRHNKKIGPQDNTGPITIGVHSYASQRHPFYVAPDQ